MNDLQNTFLILSASFSSHSCCFSYGNFWDNFKNRCFLISLRFRVCDVVFIHEKENWQCFPPFCHATFHHALITCCNVARAGYVAKSGPREQESTNGSPCLVEWKSRNITRGFILYCRDSPRVFNFHFPFGTSPYRSGETDFLVSTLIVPFTFPSLRFEYSELG